MGFEKWINSVAINQTRLTTMKKIILSLILAVHSQYAGNIAIAGAAQKVNLNKVNYCNLSKPTNNDYEPENFETSNNLLHEAGRSPLFCGEKIIISGVVLDENCVPVGDARVYLWQVDCKGKYPYKPLKRFLDDKLIGKDNVLTFSGNGVAVTNNKGEFHFVTVYPASSHGLPSHVNVRVQDYRLGELQTRLFLKGNKLANPEFYPELGNIAKIAVKNNISIYQFKVVMPGTTEDNY